MFFKAASSRKNIDTLISVGTRIEGDISFRGRLRLDGAVRGNVSALSDQPGTLVLGEKAHIDGNIQAPRVVVNGAIDGQVKDCDTIELLARARISGEVNYTSMEIHYGAVIDGRLVHHLGAGLGQAAAKRAPRG